MNCQGSYGNPLCLYIKMVCYTNKQPETIPKASTDRKICQVVTTTHGETTTITTTTTKATTKDN